MFANYLLQGKNQREAYQLVYPDAKSLSGINASASKLANNPKVNRYMAEKLNIIESVADEQLTAEVSRIIKEDKRLAFSDIREIFQGDTLIAPSELPKDVARAIKSIDVKDKVLVSKKGEQLIERVYKYQFWSKDKALERLGRFNKMYSDDSDKEQAPTINIVNYGDLTVDGGV